MKKYFVFLSVPFAALVFSIPTYGQQVYSQADLEAMERQSRTTFNELRYGSKQPGPQDQKAIEKMAKYFTFFMTIRSRQEGPPGFLQKIRDNLSRDITISLRPDKKAVTAKFRELFAKEMTKNLYEVVSMDFKRNKLSVINGAQLLPIVARLGQKEFGNLLLKLTQKDQHDIIRLFAFKAQQEHFKHKPPEINQFLENSERKYEISQVNPMIEYILTPPKGLAEMSSEEKAAYQYIRKEAIGALAGAKFPAMVFLPPMDTKMIESPVAYALLRVLTNGKDKLSPPPSLAEKIEAAIGLCNLQAEELPRYNPDIAICLIGNTLIEFAEEYRKDRGLFLTGRKVTLPPKLPWRGYSKLLDEALANLEKNTPRSAKTAKLLPRVVQTAKSSILNLTQGAGYPQIESPALLRNRLKELPSPDPVVYKDSNYKIDVQWPPF